MCVFGLLAPSEIRFGMFPTTRVIPGVAVATTASRLRCIIFAFGVMSLVQFRGMVVARQVGVLALYLRSAGAQIDSEAVCATGRNLFHEALFR